MNPDDSIIFPLNQNIPGSVNLLASLMKDFYKCVIELQFEVPKQNCVMFGNVTMSNSVCVWPFLPLSTYGRVSLSPYQLLDE